MNSPLLEADPASINELFSREPETITDLELTLMVKELRKQRENWNTTEKNKAAKPKAPVSAVDIDNLLKDL